MAMSLNKVQIIGNLTDVPELRQIPGGQTVANFSIATNFVWKNSAGEKQEQAEFHNVIAWRRLAEICGEYLRKGSKVYIEGRLKTRNWEGEDGVKRYKTEIIADNMIMLDRKGAFSNEENREAGGIKSKEEKSVSEKSNTEKEEEVKIDDLPF